MSFSFALLCAAVIKSSIIVFPEGITLPLEMNTRLLIDAFKPNKHPSPTITFPPIDTPSDIEQSAPNLVWCATLQPGSSIVPSLISTKGPM